MFVKPYVIAQNALAAKAEVLREKLEEDRGEVAGEVMVTLMMVTAAAAVYAKKDALKALADDLAGQIG